MTALLTCPNSRCFDGGFPYWDAEDIEHECPDCHGTGVTEHICDDTCRRLGFSS